MKIQFLLLCLLSSIFLITGCDDDDDSPATETIQIRLYNETGENLTELALRFFPTDSSDYQLYGPLDTGELSDYLGFEAAGSCDFDLRFCLADFDDCQNPIGLCDCVCLLDPGNYTGTISSIVNDTVSSYLLGFSLDE